MRPHVLHLVKELLRHPGFLPPGPLDVAEFGSLVVEGQEELALRPAVLEALPYGSRYVGVDMRGGPGVDVVADMEDEGASVRAMLQPYQWTPAGREVNGFDVVLCVDTLEHVRRPWLAARTLAASCAPSGYAIVVVPFAFEVHEHPHDYYRYTQDGLRALLSQFFGTVQTAQDPDGTMPHTVVAVAQRPFVDLGSCPTPTVQRRAALVADVLERGTWRTRTERFLPNPGGHVLLAGLPSAELHDRVVSFTRAAVGQPESLEARYERLCKTPSDINEHLPMLRHLVEEVVSEPSTRGYVIELGTRGAVSTTALLMGLHAMGGAAGGALHVVDVDPVAVGGALAALGPVAGDMDMQGFVDDTGHGRREVIGDRPMCDLLFIDTLHTYEQLLRELNLWASDLPDYDANTERSYVRPAVRRYVVLHDTETFGEVGEDVTTPGLRAAVDAWLAQENRDSTRWRILHDFKHNNGLMVLERVG